jgi:hypothetical protein
MPDYMNFVNEDYVLEEIYEPIYEFTIKCKYDTLDQIIHNIKLTLIYSEHGITIKYKKKIIKEILYLNIKSWKLINNLFHIIMKDVEYIFKIKKNEGIYCNLAMGYFTHKLAYKKMVEKNKILQLDKI